MSRAAPIPLLLASLLALAACEGGYTEATSPCVGADAPRLSFHAGPGPGCDFTAVGAP